MNTTDYTENTEGEKGYLISFICVICVIRGYLVLSYLSNLRHPAVRFFPFALLSPALLLPGER
jgi:hypothetical protein